jgi:lipopolysaccharide export system protein LptA
VNFRPAASLGALLLALLLAAPHAEAQNFGLGLNGQDNGKPIDIEADNGIEWQQNNHVYIARGNAKAVRGQTTVYGDTLMAFYRPVCGPTATGTSAASGGTAGPAPKPAAKPQATATPGATPQKDAAAPPDCVPAAQPPAQPAASANPGASAPKSAGSGDPIGGNSTQIYRLEADGNVRITTDTQTVYGDHAVYDVDQAVLVVTGKHLKLETPRDTVTARDSLEWYDTRQLAVARGDAVAIQVGKRMRGDVLTAEVIKDQNQSSHISRIDASGNVLVSSQDQIARGDTGVYNVDTGIATLTGRVTLTRADNELRGQYAVVDLNNNVSRLLSTPPTAAMTAGKPARVEGLLVPRQKPPLPTEPKQTQPGQ